VEELASCLSLSAIRLSLFGFRSSLALEAFGIGLAWFDCCFQTHFGNHTEITKAIFSAIVSRLMIRIGFSKHGPAQRAAAKGGISGAHLGC